MKITPIGRVVKNEDGRNQIEVFSEYQDGLYRIDEIDEILVLYIFDQIEEVRLRVHPRGDPHVPKVGVFASRSPLRPNRIATSIVKLIKVKDNILIIGDIDAFDGSPVIDIKPVKRFNEDNLR
ncbi:MAG: tRNA (N6-threonylcarbamoyladenosine(37)-N6)-methyltransferase TrmO [Euryarchaeota archaeon]|nr:tRNA (N6-threonylcarbamoyladenosine(37)-N6)-methyltransferase TrmO [Euryarchaeota archaeon]